MAVRKIALSSKLLSDDETKELASCIQEGRFSEAADFLVVRESQTSVSEPNSVYPLLAPFRTRRKEYFFVITLNGANAPINVHTVSMGTVNRTIVHPREVFLPAIMDRANAIIIAHNHPSGKLEFSEEDRNITERLKQAGDILGISVLDHILIAPKAGNYVSMVEIGRMP